MEVANEWAAVSGFLNGFGTGPGAAHWPTVAS
jgi:hypothetical protein